MITVPAMLPLYTRLRMDPLTLTCTTALAAGTMNMLPWAGPTTRAASALHVSTNEVFLPVLPAMLVGLIVVFGLAVADRTERNDGGSQRSVRFLIPRTSARPGLRRPVADAPGGSVRCGSSTSALTAIALAALVH